jgi:antitoxin ParD1/3/4
MGLHVVLSQEVTQFIERKLEQGEYGSADELIENAVRMLKLGDRDEPIGQTDHEKLQWLRAAYLTGPASGDAGSLDIESVMAEARRRRAANRR